MSEGRTGRRGSYAKGIAKREEILARALDLIARQGIRGASVKELAGAVGLSQAGLLHYFDSKEELFTEILRKRDELDTAQAAAGSALGRIVAAPGAADLDALRDGYVGIARHNTEVPGLVQLFARLSVDAADPDHPAHAFFLERGASLRALFRTAVAGRQQAGEISGDIDPDAIARIFQAVADGLQLQWMLEPDVDMAATLEALFELLLPHPQKADADT